MEGRCFIIVALSTLFFIMVALIVHGCPLIGLGNYGEKLSPKEEVLRNGDEWVKRLSKIAAQKRLKRAAERNEKRSSSPKSTTEKQPHET